MQRDDALLTDMLVAARRARSHMDGRGLAELRSNGVVLDATMLQLLVIGEAANRVSEQRRDELSAIPWHAIVGMRNRLIHGYRSVDVTEVWSTVENDLPALIHQLERVLPGEA